MKKLFAIAFATFLACSVQAQDDFKHFGLGLGFGVNYGGLGANLTYAPIRYLSFTGHAGFNFLDFTAGIGANAYLNPRGKMYRPNLKILYGYNGVILNLDLEEYNKTYFGFTVGFGNEFRFGARKAHGFDVDLLVPLRKKEFYDDYDTMKDDPRVEILADPMPIAISIGYHFDF